jgi:serine/threonine protein kinase/ABC-type glycerol-3-phosphate transport system substrate-binding protein
MVEGIRLGKYALLERIAVGGMAEVFRAAIYGAEGFAKELIIKRILPDISEDQSFVRMFIDEARLASQLDHPNIVQVFDFDCADGVYFIAMEYVRGRDLGYVLKRAGEGGAKLPEAAALYVFAQLLEALRYAHEKTDAEGRPLEIVHRDVSPQNILLSFEGEVKLADFGIAKAAGSSRTATGSLKGKYRYMAPEYVLKQKVDQRSDIYAAGAVLYELATNQRPFRDGNDMSLLTDIAAGNFKRPRDVDGSIPPAISSLIETAMALDPKDRFPSARAFLESLKETCRARNVELGPEPLRRYLWTHLPKELETTRKIDVPTAAQKTVPIEPPTKLLRPRPFNAFALGWRPAILLFAALLAAFTTYYVVKPRPRLGVMLRMMTAQEDWIRNEVLTPYGEAAGWDVAISRYRSVQDVEAALRADPSISLVKVEQTMLRPLAQADLIVPLDVYLKDRGRAAELKEMVAAFEPEALALGMVPDHVELRLYGLPRKLETSVMIYRRSKVKEAAEKWTADRERLEDQLARLVGHGLPRGYRLEENPSEWDLYDVLVAGYYWARAPERTRTEPRLMNRSYAYVGTFNHLYDELSSLTTEPKPELELSESMIDLFEWEALMRELGLYQEKMFVEEEVVTGRVVQDAMARGDIYLTRMHSLGIKLLFDDATEEVKSDLGVALLPLGVSLQLDSEGAPARIGSRRAAVSSWFWAIPKSAPHPEEGYQLARHLTSKAIAERETEAFLIQPARRDVRTPSSPLAVDLFPVLEVQMKIGGGHRLPAPPTREDADRMIDRLVRAWWRIIGERTFLEQGRIDRRRIARELEEILR